MEFSRLSEVAYFSDKKTKIISQESYVSTENMIPNKGGVTLAETTPDVQSASKYLPNDILLSNIRPYFKKIWLSNREGSCSNDVLIIRAKNTIDPKFLYYVLSTDTFFDYDTLTSKGTKMPRGTKNAIMKYFVPNFSLPFQRRIAEILSAYDALIENNNKRIKLLERMAENLYREWFVRFRFPGHEDTPIIDGIPEGWKTEKIGNVCNIFTGKKDVNQSDPNGKYTFFSCSPEKYYSNDYIYDGKAIIVAGNGSYTGRTTFFHGKFDLYQRTYALVAKNKEKDNIILYLYARFKFDFEKIFLGGTRGAAIPYIVRKDLSHYKFFYNNEIVQKYIDIIAPSFEEIDQLKGQIAILARQRDALLPRLMSGKLEVKSEKG